jgi:acetylornithine/N-succinyldiaminopimelate aminotransferase
MSAAVTPETSTETKSDQLRERFAAAMMGNYGTPPLTLARGNGSRVWDADGVQYLDLIAGIAVSALGHAHPAIVSAVTEQVSKIAHTSNLFVHEPGVKLAEKLQSLLHQDARVFFCNSGTEANEAALKIVRRRQGPHRTVIVAADHGFHGRSMGSLAITGKESIREPFGPFGFDVRWVEYGSPEDLRRNVDDQVAAVFLEPALGEGGVIPAPPGYLAAARQACDATGALLVLDEIQSGIGRTGAWFAHQAEGVLPDVMTLAKGLGGGLPIGATIGFGEAGSALRPGDHGSTFGGNPVACAAALAVLETIERDDLLANVKAVGETLASGIAGLQDPLLSGVRGTGLWLAAVLTEPKAPEVTAAAREAGFLVNAVQPDAVRLAPPLIFTQAEAAEFVAALPGILTAAQEA